MTPGLAGMPAEGARDRRGAASRGGDRGVRRGRGRGAHGRGRTRCQRGRASLPRRPATEAQRRHTRCTRSAAPPDSGKVSGQLTCGKRTSCERLSDNPHTVSFRPGSQASPRPRAACDGRPPRRTTARRRQRRTACRVSYAAPWSATTVLGHLGTRSSARAVRPDWSGRGRIGGPRLPGSAEAALTRARPLHRPGVGPAARASGRVPAGAVGADQGRPRTQSRGPRDRLSPQRVDEGASRPCGRTRRRRRGGAVAAWPSARVRRGPGLVRLPAVPARPAHRSRPGSPARAPTGGRPGPRRTGVVTGVRQPDGSVRRPSRRGRRRRPTAAGTIRCRRLRRRP